MVVSVSVRVTTSQILINIFQEKNTIGKRRNLLELTDLLGKSTICFKKDERKEISNHRVLFLAPA